MPEFLLIAAFLFVYVMGLGIGWWVRGQHDSRTHDIAIERRPLREVDEPPWPGWYAVLSRNASPPDDKGDADDLCECEGGRP